jgi:tetratricopeptide (TPR) repeat protein
MSSGRKMTVQELAELALFLANEGADYQRAQPDRAMTRFAQSLSVFRQLNAPNEAWVAFILYSIGQLKTPDQRALAFYESAVQVQRRLGLTQEVADSLRQYGQAAARIKAYPHAQDWLGKALVIYQILGLAQPVKSLWAEIGHLPIDPQHQPDIAPQPHAFEIRVLGQPRDRFRVAPDGVVQWTTVGELAQSTPLGLTGWEVVCIDQ